MNGGAPVRDILGVENSANPFEVLGLPLRVVSDAEVVDALSARMAQVASHRLSETPEGNEVRLALHAAAAQMLDRRIREALYVRAGIVGSVPSRVSTPGPTVLGPKAMMVIAGEGGWNSRALRRLAMIAHAEGIPSTAIPGAIQGLVGDANRQGPASDEARRGRRPQGPQSSSEPDRLGAGVIAVTLLAAIVTLVLTWTLLQAGTLQPAQTNGIEVSTERSEAKPPPIRTPVPPSEVTAIEDGGPAEPNSPVTVGEEPDWAAALLGLRDSREAVDIQTAQTILEGLASTWVEMDTRSIERTVAAFIDVLYAMSPADAEALVGWMASGIQRMESPVSGLFSGLLNRLAVERSLPTSVDNAVVSALVSTVGVRQGTQRDVFAAGAAAGLEMKSDEWAAILPTELQLALWLQSVDAVHRLDETIGAALAREALRGFIRSVDDPLASGESLMLVDRLAERLQPDASPDDAAFVVSVLGDSGITTRSASVVVNTLARRGVTGDGSDQIRLAPNASDAERAESRKNLAELWLGDDAGPASASPLLEIVESHLRSGPGVTPAEQVADAVVSARLANACRLALWGAMEESEDRLVLARAGIDQLLSLSAGGGGALQPGDDAWALRYLEAERNIPVRLSLLNELVQSPRELGPIGAELVVAEAVNGSPARIRREAQSIVRVMTNHASILNAILEVLPTVPRVRSVETMVEQAAGRTLPSIDSEEWAFEARRVLVDRLLESLVGRGGLGNLDQLAGLLASEIAEMVEGGSSMPNDPVGLAESLVEQRAQELRRIDLAGTSALRMDGYRGLWTGRRALARGAVTRFAAAQVTATEVLSEVVRLEQPQRVVEVERIMRELRESRAESSSVFAQIALVERASLDLWLIRLGEQP